jgi:diadenosine tetraphosphate (Ap4A) HIT family hydrolase
MRDCALCQADLGRGVKTVFETPRWRVVRVLDEPAFPGFYRLIWTDHVAEFSALARAERQECMEAVSVVERVLLEQLRPAKINLASLGNMVAHLHWHVIARFEGDTHFPRPIWAAPVRAGDVAGAPSAALGADALATVDQAVAAALSRWVSTSGD